MDFKEVKRLYALGFAIHWLKPKSKVPLLPGWTKGPRTELVELKKLYRKGMNVGVRLGKVSKIKNAYLAVIDVDIKSEENRHRLEAEKKVLELFPEVKNAPQVLSGRGNGSCHYYVLTKEPISVDSRKGQSKEFVKISMPSSKPSAKETKELTTKELNEGIRIRAAWEVSLLSEGRQVVLPGSLHPDTGKLYKWYNPVSEEGQNLPIISVKKYVSGALEDNFEESTTPVEGLDYQVFNFVPVDENLLGLREDQLAALRTGEGVEDRSGYVFGLTMSLLQKKLSDIKIISLLTDRKFFLSQMPYDHAKTRNRNRAANWFVNYTLKKAKKKVREIIFDEVEEIFEDEEISKEVDVEEKMLVLDKTEQGKLRSTFHNVLTILQNKVGHNLLKRNLFSNEDFFGCDTPWGYKKGRKRSSGMEDALEVKNWLIQSFNLEVNVNTIEEAFLFITSQNEFHPVKEFLESLEWDGVERVSKAFKTYLNARMPEPYLSEVSRKFFLALITRIYEPGSKFDHLPVLEGTQGIGKSSFGKIIVGPEWFMDGLPDLSDKDAALNLQGVWLVEMGELSSIYRSQLEAAKAFITRQVDKVRPPYGKRRVDLPRQCVFLGTTDKMDYLQDSAGNRRFWPVKVMACEFEQLEKDRLQLLAESKFIYDFANEPLWLSGEAKIQSERIQETRRVETDGDEMQDLFLNWLGLPEKERNIDIKKIAINDLFNIGPFSTFQKTQSNRISAANVLRKAGYSRVHTREGKRWVSVSKK
jgi:predicted P-loop ATPase